MFDIFFPQLLYIKLFATDFVVACLTGLVLIMAKVAWVWAHSTHMLVVLMGNMLGFLALPVSHILLICIAWDNDITV